MPIHSFRSLLQFLAVGFTAFAASHSFGLTVLTNDGFTDDNQPIPGTINYEQPNQTSTYGSNVSGPGMNWTVAPGVSEILGTPDISLLWSTGLFQTYTNWDGRGNVVQLDSFTPPIQSPIFHILFTPTAEFAVSLVSFDLDAWAGSPDGDVVVEWTLSNATSSLIYGSGQFSKPALLGGRETIFVNYTGLAGQPLLLTFHQTGGDGSYLALDNLTFDQVVAVPEASTTAFVGVGLAALAIAGRRRRNGARGES